MVKIIFRLMRKAVFHSLSHHKRFMVPMRVIDDFRVDEEKRIIVLFCDKCYATILVQYKSKGEITTHDWLTKMRYFPPEGFNCRCSTMVLEKVNDNIGEIEWMLSRPNIFGRFDESWKEVYKLMKE